MQKWFCGAWTSVSVPQVMPEPTDERPELTHVDSRGNAHMVDVSQKPATVRVARAEAMVRLTPELRQRLLQGTLPKGEALAVARIAGIQAAKDTARLIPLCHPLPLSDLQVEFAPSGAADLRIETTARTVGPTGVEMEALVAASVAALTVYDMVKALHRGAAIEQVQLLHKAGGKSGTWNRSDVGAVAPPAAPPGSDPTGTAGP